MKSSKPRPWTGLSPSPFHPVVVSRSPLSHNTTGPRFHHPKSQGRNWVCQNNKKHARHPSSLWLNLFSDSSQCQCTISFAFSCNSSVWAPGFIRPSITISVGQIDLYFIKLSWFLHWLSNSGCPEPQYIALVPHAVRRHFHSNPWRNFIRRDPPLELLPLSVSLFGAPRLKMHPGRFIIACSTEGISPEPLIIHDNISDTFQSTSRRHFCTASRQIYDTDRTLVKIAHATLMGV